MPRPSARSGASPSPCSRTRARPRSLRAYGWSRPAASRARTSRSRPGPLLLVGLDLGLVGVVDRDQGRWLAEVSTRDARPKILISSKPTYADGHYTPTPIEDGGTVDEIVRDPAANYVAVVSGEIHNYQRYPVAVPGGRTIQYIVCGGGGAFTQGTHTIGRIDIPNPEPVAPAGQGGRRADVPAARRLPLVLQRALCAPSGS